MKRLGVNIDHIATLRNARGEKHPNPVFAAKKVIKLGADSVTIHLREDRRHINDLDTKEICALNKVLVNLEVSMNSEIIKKALRYKPNYICIVPENRKEITTEGGLNLKDNYKKLKEIISKFKKSNIRTSLFINPNLNDIKLSKKLNVDCVEIHTGKLANYVKSHKNFSSELKPIIVDKYFFTITRNKFLIAMNIDSGKIIYSNDLNLKIAEFLNTKKTGPLAPAGAINPAGVLPDKFP